MPIVWHDATGTVLGVTTLAEGWLDAQRGVGETTAQAVARLAPEIAAKWAPGALPPGATFTLIRAANMPTDRTRRASWRVVGDRVEEGRDGEGQV